MADDLVALYQNKTGKKPYFYNIMPIENITSVIKNGILSYNEVVFINHQSIAMTEVQERRKKVFINNGGNLHDYANLYFDYHNPMMYKRKNQAEDLCVLAVDASVLNIRGCILSDKNAATDFVRFFSPEDGINNIDFNLVFNKDWRDADIYEMKNKKAAKCAEVLVPKNIPYKYIAGAYVLNENSKENLSKTGFDKQISINARVFFR